MAFEFKDLFTPALIKDLESYRDEWGGSIEDGISKSKILDNVEVWRQRLACPMTTSYQVPTNYKMVLRDSSTWVRIWVQKDDDKWIIRETKPYREIWVMFDLSPSDASLDTIRKIIEKSNVDNPKFQYTGGATTESFIYLLITNSLDPCLLPRWVDVEPVRRKLIGI